jgi:DNA polymerase III delta prime subunit
MLLPLILATSILSQIIKVNSLNMSKIAFLLNSFIHPLEANYFVFFISVLVLYEVDKAPENIQPLMKWIMDCYTDACKLILCCEDDSDILETVKNRCKVLKVDAPVTHEVRMFRLKSV